MTIVLYLLVSAFCVAIYCLTTKKADKENVDVGTMTDFIILSLVPFLNVGSAIFCLLYTADRTGFWKKKLF